MMIPYNNFVERCPCTTQEILQTSIYYTYSDINVVIFTIDSSNLMGVVHAASILSASGDEFIFRCFYHLIYLLFHSRLSDSLPSGYCVGIEKLSHQIGFEIFRILAEGE